MKKIFSIWENTSKTGNTYYSGKIGEVELIGFRVKDKKSEKSPDIEFYVKEDKPKEKQQTTIYAKDIDTKDVFQEFGEQIDITDNMLD